MTSIAQTKAWLLPLRCEVLADHLDGVLVPVVVKDSARASVTDALVTRGLLKFENSARPRWTVITERGRAVLSSALADMADMLSVEYKPPPRRDADAAAGAFQSALERHRGRTVHDCLEQPSIRDRIRRRA